MSTHGCSRDCPICGNNTISTLHTQEFVQPDFVKEITLLPQVYDVVACLQCGFVYADTSLEQSGYDEYYEKCSKYEGEPDVSSGGLSTSDMLRYERVILQLEDIVNKDTAILDIGCANGGLLHALKINGYANVFGLDPSLTCVKNTDKLEIPAFNGSLFCNKLGSKKKFGLIILSHVLEHIRDLYEAMEAALELLEESGFIYIEVPNAKEYESHYIVPFYYFDSEHINHFDKDSLNNLLEFHGIQCFSCIEKNIQVSETQDYPAVAVLGIKKKEQREKRIKCAMTKESILRYVEKSKQDEKYSYIDNLVNSDELVVIWGAGSYTSRLLSGTNLGKCNILMFIDNDENKQGMKIKGKHVFSADKLYGFNGNILIASAIHSGEIVTQIRTMGLENEIIIL
jgi:2-polyprenyl-3-methyl-5-hydroxy-6-metoxy-1,4-benzoquinol methylase